MGISWKIKDIIDWGRRFHWLWTVVLPLLGSATAGVAMKAFLISHTHVPEIWRLPLYLACATVAIIVFGLAGDWLAKRPKDHPQTEAREVLEKVMLAGAEFAVCDLMWCRARYISIELETLWHTWNNEGERLIHPLTSVDKLKNYYSDHAQKLLDKRREFLVLYGQHIVTMESSLPDFKSGIVEAGYPSDLPYVEARSALDNHIEDLEKQSKKTWEKYGRPIDTLK